jgi:hypothetical protein
MSLTLELFVKEREVPTLKCIGAARLGGLAPAGRDVLRFSIKRARTRLDRDALART